MLYWFLYLKNMLRREEGQDLAEYALLLALIAILIVGALIAFREQLEGVFESISAAIGAGT
jgi:pilus assembly protein Flp/PilA